MVAGMQDCRDLSQQQADEHRQNAAAFGPDTAHSWRHMFSELACTAHGIGCYGEFMTIIPTEQADPEARVARLFAPANRASPERDPLF